MISKDKLKDYAKDILGEIEVYEQLKKKIESHRHKLAKAFIKLGIRDIEVLDKKGVLLIPAKWEIDSLGLLKDVIPNFTKKEKHKCLEYIPRWHKSKLKKYMKKYKISRKKYMKKVEGEPTIRFEERR